jgi:hypothetical protein
MDELAELFRRSIDIQHRILRREEQREAMLTHFDVLCLSSDQSVAGVTARDVPDRTSPIACGGERSFRLVCAG